MARRKRLTTSITFSVSPGMASELEDYAEKHDLNMSETVRDLLDRALNQKFTVSDNEVVLKAPGVPAE